MVNNANAIASTVGNLTNIEKNSGSVSSQLPLPLPLHHSWPMMKLGQVELARNRMVAKMMIVIVAVLAPWRGVRILSRIILM